MQNLREAHGYTYGASSQLSSDFLVGSFQAGASVRNEVTDSSVFEFMNELTRIVNEPVKENELAAAKASIAGAFGRSLENPQTIATFAVNTAKYNLPKDYYNNYLKSIDAVTIADVQASAKQFIMPGKAHIIVVGKGSEIADKLKKYGDIRYFDMYGKEVIAAKTTPLPAGLTAEKVISKYIEAIGGEKNVKAVKSMKTSMKGSVQGQELVLTLTTKSPGKMIQEVSAGGQMFQRTVSDGKDVATTTMGQKEPMDEKIKEAKLFDAAMFKELEYPAYKVKAELKSIENVDGKEAYVVEYTTPKGEKTSDYYDKETGLKIQTVSVQKGPQGEAAVATKFGDYKEVKGVKVPHSISQAMGPMTLKFEAQAVEVNLALDDALFKVQ
jgi:hypothetical protein